MWFKVNKNNNSPSDRAELTGRAHAATSAG